MRGFLFVQQAPPQTEGGDPNWKPPEAAVVVPEAIKKIAATPFPADGKIHVIGTKGRIEIKPETPVCYMPDGFFVESRKLFEALGQPSATDEGGRIQPAAKGRCKFSKDVVLFNGGIGDNRNGKPYKLVLSVWQSDASTDGAAYWIAGIERLNGLRPEHVDIAAEDPGNLKSYIGASSARDIGDFAEKFIPFVTGRLPK
jgi:hypothetical protein